MNVLWMGVILATILLGMTGCGTVADEASNDGSKPWNSPEGYQNGALPSGLFH